MNGRHKKAIDAAYRLRHHCLLCHSADAAMDKYHSSGQYERDLTLVVTVVRWKTVLKPWDDVPLSPDENLAIASDAEPGTETPIISAITRIDQNAQPD